LKRGQIEQVVHTLETMPSSKKRLNRMKTRVAIVYRQVYSRRAEIPSRPLELLFFFNDTSAERTSSRLKWQFYGRLYGYKLSKWVLDGERRGGLKTARKYLENTLAESTGEENSSWR